MASIFLDLDLNFVTRRRGRHEDYPSVRQPTQAVPLKDQPLDRDGDALPRAEPRRPRVGYWCRLSHRHPRHLWRRWRTRSQISPWNV
jgi:hypothetical protein